jgi:hypothetical protein
MKIRAQSFVVLMALVCLSSLSGSALMQATQKNNAQQSSAGPSAANAGQSNAQKPSSGTCELNDEDYAVFTAILKGLGKPEDPEEAWKGKEILVTNVTGQGTVEKNQWNGWGFRSNSSAAPSEETRRDFESKGKDKCPLKEGWGDPQMYKPLSNVEVESYFEAKRGKRHDGWEDFYAKHPKAAGFWTFSRPGYNGANDEAVLYVTHSCGWLCGTGHLYLLAKQDGQWKVKNRLFLWIS